MRRSSILRTAGVALMGAGVIAGVGSLVVRDQLSRHQRGLFSGQALKRFAALGYLSGTPASVELVQLLRDFCAWEQNTILRRRAQQVIARMERQLEQQQDAAAAAASGRASGRASGSAGDGAASVEVAG